ncbi:MAG: membrane dipeptidase [Gemmatimonadota bacterium]
MTRDQGMTRREFARDIVAATAIASTVSITGAAAVARAATQDDANDRSQGRDPMAIHRSTIVMNGLDPSSLSVEYLDLLKQGGVAAWLRAEHQTLTDLADSHAFYARNRDRIVAARTVREIRAAHNQGKVAQILGWQSSEQLSEDSNQGALAGPAIANLRGYYELGLRTCGIAYNLANVFGAGCLEPHIGLTRNGRKLVEEIHKLRMVLDVGGHTGEQTSLDALAMSSGVPVMCSHTNIKTLNDNPRCTSDRVLEAIAKTGGVIGLTGFNDFHARTRNDAGVLRTPQVGLEKHLDQYDYLKKLVGVDHVGLGPDFTFGGTKPVPEPPRERSAAESGAKIPDRNANGSEQFASPEAYSVLTPWFYVKGFENISELPNVTRGLIQRGWSTGEIRKVLGENWLRVYETVWGE